MAEPQGAGRAGLAGATGGTCTLRVPCGDFYGDFYLLSLQVVADQIPMLVQGVRGSQSQPDSPSAQLALIAASQNFLQVPPNLLLAAGSQGTASCVPPRLTPLSLGSPVGRW